MEIREYEIWVGYYRLGFAPDDGPTEPFMVGKETASSFQIACYKFELKRMLINIEVSEQHKKPINRQDLEWNFQLTDIANDWTGRYYETKEEAHQSFVSANAIKEYNLRKSLKQKPL